MQNPNPVRLTSMGSKKYQRKTGKSRSTLAAELYISYTTLWRRLRATGIKLPPGKISPENEALIRRELGYFEEE